MKVSDTESVRKDKIERMFQKLIDSKRKGTSPIGKHYRSHFNLLDLHDRYFYKVVYPHRILNWHTALALDLINVLVVNSWVLYSQGQLVQFKDYRRDLAAQLLQYK